jgi:hypothetical protein
MENTMHFLAGCSFTDPVWQEEIPWSVEYAKLFPSYIVSKAGMGIYGICTESLYYLQELENISQVIIILPTLWRLDIEVDQETNLGNSIIDLIRADAQWSVIKPGVRKWLISGGLHYNKKTEQAKIFEFLYTHKGFLVLAKEHFRALKLLINYCKDRKINYYISAIKDPLDQLVGLDYIRPNICDLLNEVEYDKWIRFDGKFIDKFLDHEKHPSTSEHKIISDYLINICNNS